MAASRFHITGFGLVLAPLALATCLFASGCTSGERRPPTQPSHVLAPPQQVAPPDGSTFGHYPRTTEYSWLPVDGASGYRLEVDCFHCCELGQWCADIGRTYFLSPTLSGTTYSHNFAGAQPGRWRTWAVDSAGNEGTKSGWWTFTYTR